MMPGVYRISRLGSQVPGCPGMSSSLCMVGASENEEQIVLFILDREYTIKREKHNPRRTCSILSWNWTSTTCFGPTGLSSGDYVH